MTAGHQDPPAPLPGVPAFCPAGAPLRPGPLPAGTTTLTASSALGATAEATGPDFVLPGLPPATWAVQAWSAAQQLLGEELTVVAEHPGSDPVMGFATTFTRDGTGPVAGWLRALRCTVVQAYDWMASYSRPLPASQTWHDPLGRPVELAALRALAGELAAAGTAMQAYAPVYAADPPFASAHPQLRLYRNDGHPEHLGDLLEIMDPGSPRWQRHWIAAHQAAVAAAGFTGLHLDTYGYPRAAHRHTGQPASMHDAYRAFLARAAAVFPDLVVSFNQVNGVPPGIELSAPRRFRYIEAWPPNNQWRHLEGLIARGAGTGAEPVVLAVYPPVWSAGRAAALRTVLLTEAILTTLGAGLLVWGDNHAVLRQAYYPDHERLSEAEARTVLRWHRFALRHRDLFHRATDTSWHDIGDENASVTARASAPASPEPLGGTLFTRVSRRDTMVAVSLIDLTGSEAGRWDQPTGPPTAAAATLDVLIDQPSRWTAQTAAPGHHGGRFHPVAVTVVSHREGTALRLNVPMPGGWAIARLARH